jgi:XTP/dITP diphosphohydrolase
LSAATDHPACADVEEDEPTLEGNAEKKARWIAAWTGIAALADDTGLEVDALDGQPGVLSARFAGPGCTFEDNNAKLLGMLAGLGAERRTARFRCVVALAFPGPAAGGHAERVRDCRVSLFAGRIEGRILAAPRGRRGFGYDPVFFLPELGRTLAELTLEEKNRTSHRARALLAAREALRRWLDPAAAPGRLDDPSTRA